MKKTHKLLTFITVLCLLAAFAATGCAPASSPSDDGYTAASDAADDMAYDSTGSNYDMTEDTMTGDTTADSADGMVFEQPEWNAADDTSDYQPPAVQGSEEYGEYTESPFLSPLTDPLSTFSIDVDTASYSNIRRYLTDGMLPPAEAVRVEECINYFDYDYESPTGAPVGVDVTISDCPWNPGRYLARVTVQAQDLDLSETPPGNIVFLLDVSGSMDSPDKLPLVKSALLMLADNLSSQDRVSIVVYAGASGVVLEGCRGSDKSEIEWALNQLTAGGSTAGGEGIELAYRVAEEYFITGGNNRVILCTDGDFNVGPSSAEALERLIEEKRDSGVFLSVLGFGDGNLKDEKMETLADKGNGNYAYIDSLMEAKKVLVGEMTSTLYTVAKDVKVQIEFNPAAVKEYRLVGYDNRRLEAQDFNDDRKDAGEMGAGHTVTVFYEIILNGSPGSGNIDDLVFQDNEDTVEYETPADDWLYVKVRYKEPDEDTSKLITLMAGKDDFTQYPDSDFRFASAVAEFALILKQSDYMGYASMSRLIERARGAKDEDADGYRAQFVQLAELAYEMIKY